MRIEFSYTRGTETNYSWAADEKEYERVKKQKEKDGWVVSLAPSKKSFEGWPVTAHNTDVLVKLFGVIFIELLESGEQIYLDPRNIRVVKLKP